MLKFEAALFESVHDLPIPIVLNQLARTVGVRIVCFVTNYSTHGQIKKWFAGGEISNLDQERLRTALRCVRALQPENNNFIAGWLVREPLNDQGLTPVSLIAESESPLDFERVVKAAKTHRSNQ